MPSPPAERTRPSPFSAVVCTRNRPDQLLRTLEALRNQTRGDFSIYVIDQSDEPDPGLEDAAREDPRLRVIRDPGRGLSRARNIGWRHAATPWVVYVDDDCLPEREWSEQLAAVIAEQPAAELIGCYVEDPEPASATHVSVSVFRPAEERLISGRWVRPWHIGLGACLAITRRSLERLGGFDERLGAGVPDFPGAEDMDLNYRFLRSGGTACVTPRPRVVHEQWRSPQALPDHFRGYTRAWAGFCMKQARTGDRLGALWLLWTNVDSISRFLISGVLRRSGLRVRLVWPMAVGLLSGAARGWRRAW